MEDVLDDDLNFLKAQAVSSEEDAKTLVRKPNAPVRAHTRHVDISKVESLLSPRS